MKKNQVIVSELMALCAILIVAIIMVSYSTKSNRRDITNVKVKNLRNAVINGNVNEIKKPVIDSGLKDFEVYFPLNGNSVTYIFDITNNGNRDARINEINITSPTCKQNNNVVDCNIIYSLTYANSGYSLKYNDIIESGETKTVILFIKSSIDNISVSNLNIKLSYN